MTIFSSDAMSDMLTGQLAMSADPQSKTGSPNVDADTNFSSNSQLGVVSLVDELFLDEALRTLVRCLIESEIDEASMVASISGFSLPLGAESPAVKKKKKKRRK
jgi:hypothetical protein